MDPEQTFGGLVAWLDQFNAGHLALQLREQGIRNLAQARQQKPQCLDALFNQPRQLAVQQAAPRTGAAPNEPIDSRAKRGNLRVALTAAATEESRKRALEALGSDVYSSTSKKPRDSLWATWLAIAEAWKVDPYKLTPDTVSKIASSLKLGGYKSVRNYFTRARQEHVTRTGQSPSADTELAIHNAIQSCERGVGGGAVKITFAMEMLPSLRSRFYLMDLYIVGAWFMTRGIELRAAKRSHWLIDEGRKTISWHFPSSKADTKAVGVTRLHGCCCGHLPGNSQAEHPLCPYHCAVRYSKWWEEARKKFQPDAPDGYLLFEMFGTSMPQLTLQRELARILTEVGIDARSASPLTIDSASVAAEHSLRVAGAQYLARMGIDLYLIQLVGRWGSAAVARYVQDAPLVRQHLVARMATSSRALPADPQLSADLPLLILDSPAVSQPQPDTIDPIEPADDPDAPSLAQNQILALLDAPEGAQPQNQQKVIVNLTSLWYHLPTVSHESANVCWQTKCGWRYGMSKFQLKDHPPGNAKACGKCFPLTMDDTSEDE